jgi:hypothetical protein
MASRSKLPLVLASVVCLGGGAALAVMLRTPAETPTPAQSTAVAESKPIDALRLLNAAPLPDEARPGEIYLQNRWGHLEDPGLTLQSADEEGQTYYVEAQLVRGWTPNGPNYLTVISRPYMIENRIRRPQRTIQARASIEGFDTKNFHQRMREMFGEDANIPGVRSGQ